MISNSATDGGSRSVVHVPDAGDIIWTGLAEPIGAGQGPRRPALVVSPSLYNARAGVCIAALVTTLVKGYPFEVALPSGLKTIGVVVADRVRSIDLAKGSFDIVETVPTSVLNEVREKLRPLLGY